MSSKVTTNTNNISSLTSCTPKKMACYSIYNTSFSANGFVAQTVPSAYQNADMYVVRPLTWAHEIFGSVETGNALNLRSVYGSALTISEIKIWCIWFR